ncbi:MAG: biotin--[acetyl-CoA-carboxylase] ligase [Candidatus Brocadiia bacterium]
MLDAEAIRSLAGWPAQDGAIRVLGSVSSTSDIAWAWAGAGCPQWTVVLAEEQVQGRGRFGRTWVCPRGGGVLMSVVLRPPSQLVGPAHLMALGALAVAEAVAESGPEARIRWPNDVVAGGRKLAGVLVESRARRASPVYVLGVGLNVNVAREDFPQALQGRATSVAIETGRQVPREPLAGQVLRHLRHRYDQARGGHWARVADAWRRRSSLVGQTVELESRGSPVYGRVVQADPLAGIELELPGGIRRRFRAEHTTLVSPKLQDP